MTIGGTIATEPAASQRPRFHAIEVKRHATIEAVDQVCRYVEYLDRDANLRPVQGWLAAQSVTPQARTLAADRGIIVKLLDYDALRGLDDPADRLF